MSWFEIIVGIATIVGTIWLVCCGQKSIIDLVNERNQSLQQLRSEFNLSSTSSLTRSKVRGHLTPTKKLLILGLVCLAIFVESSIFALGMSHIDPAPEITIVKGYYDALMHQDYQEAYNYLSSPTIIDGQKVSETEYVKLARKAANALGSITNFSIVNEVVIKRSGYHLLAQGFVGNCCPSEILFNDYIFKVKVIRRNSLYFAQIEVGWTINGSRPVLDIFLLKDLS